MSEQLERSAEILKLARTLETSADGLDYLGELTAAELRELREAIAASLYDRGGAALHAVASAAKLVPSSVIVVIAQRAFGPLLCARAASSVDVAKAIDVAKRLPPDFLADVAVHLDPRRVASIIAAVPDKLIPGVALELAARGEFVTMGRFLGFVGDGTIATAMASLDDETMIRTAFVLEHKDRLDHALGILPPDRLPSVLRTAARLHLWAEALDLVDQISRERRGPIADVVAEQSPELVTGLVDAVQEAGLWPSLVPIVADMSDDHRRRLAVLPCFHEPEVLDAILHATGAHDQWVDLLPLIEALPDDVRVVAARSVVELGPVTVNDLVRAVESADLWDRLIPLLAEVSDDLREELIAALPDESRSLVLGHLEAAGLV